MQGNSIVVCSHAYAKYNTKALFKIRHEHNLKKRTLIIQ